MMNPGKELDSSSEIPLVSFSDIISQLNRFYGMIVSLMASNIVLLIFQALTYTGGIIAN